MKRVEGGEGGSKVLVGLGALVGAIAFAL